MRKGSKKSRSAQTTQADSQAELMRQEHALQIAQENVDAMMIAYKAQLDTSPEYSLVVDPENKYNFDVITKEFIRHYIETRNIATAATLCGIENDVALDLYRDYRVFAEVRRISKALYHRQFSKKMMSLSDIGGYLTSLIEDSEIPEADRLTTREKLGVVRMLIELNQMKLASLGDPSIVMMRDVGTMVKDLSVGAIKALLEQATPKQPPNRDVVDDVNYARVKRGEPILAPEESAYLESLPASEALKLLDEQYK